MKKLSVFRLLAVLIVAAATFSCNRGVGCPTNFSVDEWADILLQTAQLFL